MVRRAVGEGGVYNIREAQEEGTEAQTPSCACAIAAERRPAVIGHDHGKKMPISAKLWPGPGGYMDV